jgi:hypothetical protein
VCVVVGADWLAGWTIDDDVVETVEWSRIEVYILLSTFFFLSTITFIPSSNVKVS